MARMGEGVHGVVCDVFEERCYRFYGDWRAKGEIRWNPENKNAAMQLRREIDDPKGRWVDGTPMNTPYAWGLRLLFPEAKFIHLLRRPEHVAASLTKFENVGAVSQDARQGIETWMDHVYYAIMTQEAFGSETVQLVEFEKLVEDPEPAIKRICDFLGEPYSADCLIPYGKKINSSEVDDKRAEIVENIKRLPSFAKADYLHGRAIAPETGASARMEAQQILQNFFLTQCARNHN
ncbi:MAG: sulfotransferase [Pseudomonadota bacterium]